MKNTKANKILEDLAAASAKEFNAEEIVEKLKELRELAKEEKDPTVVKILRLAYEYIEQNGNFDIGHIDEEEGLDMSEFQYLMELIIHIDREVNRQEVREIRDLLIGELY